MFMARLFPNNSKCLQAVALDTQVFNKDLTVIRYSLRVRAAKVEEDTTLISIPSVLFEETIFEDDLRFNDNNVGEEANPEMGG